ncbi:hypothetical protein [Thalassotalea atypica]|uniref:hypothetical protein n=1 Tax=Thalassotalea atypica TaxID=2054316 RepID=UPI002573E434|nr:hypothetical protein [Thalassotalea atypica]
MKQPSFLKTLLKWFIITMIVFAGFITILLGLGYLLHENEKETRALKEEIEASQ